MKGKAVSGLMLFLLFLGILPFVFNVQSTEADPDPQVTLETDKDVYFLEENVVIVFKNVGNENVSLGPWPGLRIYKYIEYPSFVEPVYPKYFAHHTVDLDPEENFTVIWGQYNAFTEGPAGPGEYYVEDNGGWDLRKYFNISNVRVFPAVGGVYIPVNKLGLLAPCIGLTILLAVAAATVIYAKKRKKT